MSAGLPVQLPPIKGERALVWVPPRLALQTVKLNKIAMDIDHIFENNRLKNYHKMDRILAKMHEMTRRTKKEIRELRERKKDVHSLRRAFGINKY